MKRTHLLAAAIAGLASIGAAQTEMLTNGDFGDSTGWTAAVIGGAPTVDFNYTTSIPTGGAGGALRITGTTNPDHQMVYQAVNLTAAQSYTLSGVVRDLGSGASSVWFEVYLSQTVPVAGTDYTTNRLVAFNTWNCTGWDSSFSSPCGAGANTTTYVPPATGTYYLVLKSGSCCGGAIDVVVDEVSLIQEATPPPTGTDELVVNGAFGSATGWTLLDLDGVAADPTVDFNNTTNVPTAGAGPVLHMEFAGNTNYAVYQPILVNEGTLYTLSGSILNQSPNADGSGSGHWTEVLFSTTAPVPGSDYTTDKKIGFNSWAGTCGFGPYDTTFAAACDGSTTALLIPDPGNDGGTATYYLVLKAGASGLSTLSVSFDGVSLIGQAPVVSAVGDWAAYD